MGSILEDIKKRLIEQPEHIVRLLELFSFHKIRLRNNEIRCAFEENTNPTAIVIRLNDNDALFVKDYEKNYSYDLFNYIIKSKGYSFKEVINAVKVELGIDNIYSYKRSTGIFGGLCNKMCRSDSQMEVKTYSESILNQYQMVPNERFLNDGISLETQNKFQIGYDVNSQRITIPIRTPYGELAAIKGRANYELEEFEPKYLFLAQGPMSQLLYGFYENYDTLLDGDVKVFESEKSVLMLDSMGKHDGVAIGSNSLSATQAKLLLSLNPRSITFMLDEGLPIENTLKNIETLKTFCRLREVEIKYFDWRDSLSLPSKAAPVDCGQETYEYILENELVTFKEDNNDL